MLLHTIATLDNLAIALYQSFGNFLDDMFKEKNCDSLAKQVGKELNFEKEIINTE